MRLKKSKSAVKGALLVASAAAIAVLVAAVASAANTANATSVAPSVIKGDSAQVTVFGIDVRTDAADSLTSAKVTLNRVLGFSTGDLAGTSGATSTQGVQLWRDTSVAGGNADVLDAADTPVSTAWSNGGNDCSVLPSCTATFTMSSTPLPTAAEGAYTFFIAIRSSGTIANGDTFNLAVTTDSFTTAPAATIATPAATENIVADTSLPAVPNVGELGLSTAAGKVRVGGTAVSAENPGVLEVWRDTDVACLGGSKVFVTESSSMNLTQTNVDLVGTDAAQTAALQGIAAGPTVCYRVRDAAGNASSPYVADGTVPAAPSAGDVALLSTTNITGAKKVSATADGSPGRIFRAYLKPGGSGLERAKDQNAVTPTFVEVTTVSTGVSDSGTTDIRQFGNGSTMTVADGLAYSRVNADGNDGAVTNDGAVPAVPTVGELALLSASAADGHQRVVADPDATPGRTYGLFLDPAGLSSWDRAVTASGGTTPVRVTTAAGSAESSTTDIFAGASQLASGFSVGYVRVDAGGNESAVASNGSIPAVPVANNITYSDALNRFTVNPFPPGVAPLAVEIGLYTGSTAATAYDGTPEGTATSTAPASVGELTSGNLFYSAVNTTTGNESGLTADGSIPAAPNGTDIVLLRSSAAEGHRRVLSASDATPGQTYRLYIDTAGGSAWTRASTLSGGTTPIEVTTQNGAESSSGTTTIFAGNSALGTAHAVGYALVEGGNDSDATADGTIPAPPGTTTTSLSDARDMFTATAATSALRVNLHVNNAGDTASLAYDEAGPDGTATSATPVAFADKDAGTTVFYTITDFATGNESVTVDDGDIPGTPLDNDVALLGVSAAGGHQRVTATSDTSSRIFRLHLDPAGGAAWTAAAAPDGSAVEITTINGSAAASPTTSIIADGAQLTSGFAVGHTRVSTAGNESEVKADGLIPGAPAAGTTSATAAIDDVTATSADATNNVNIYKSVSSDPSVAYDGTPDVVMDAEPDHTKNLDTSAGDRLYYTTFLTTTRNESPIQADGAIPAAPGGATSSASAAFDTFVVPDATSANNVRIFLDPNSTDTTAYTNGVDFTADHSPFVGTDLPADYVFYTSLDDASGNESAITSDGNIPSAPTGVDGVMSASAAEQRVSSSNDSTSRTVRLYADPAGGIAFVAATTTAGGSTPVEIETSTTGQVVSAQGTYLSGSVLGANASIAYSRIFGGNESDFIVDGAIPPAPAADTFTADAADGIMTIASGAPSGTYRGFRGSTALSDRVSHTGGAPTAITVSGLIGGDVPGYALTGAAGNESPLFADGTIPAAPTALSLQTASDLGRLNNDRITSDATPTIDVSTTSGAAVTLVESSTSLGSAPADGSGVAAVTSSSLSNALHTVAAKATVAGNTSPLSNTLGVTIDTVAPATPGAPDLLAGSDSGSSNTDNITNITTPTFSVSVEADADALLFAGATQVGSAIADGTGAASPASSALTESVYQVTVQAVDVAGNPSSSSPALQVEIDTSAPAVTPAATLQTVSDTGRSATDKITSDTTPSFDVTGVTPGSSLVLRVGTTQIASGTADGSGNAALTSTALTHGTYNITVSMVDPAGNIAPSSDPVAVRIDTLAPSAPGSPVLTTDTGRSTTDGVTKNATPSFAVVTEAHAIVEIVKGGSSIGSGLADGTGSVSATVSTLADGAAALTAKATDEAGNVSAESSSTAIVLDTVAPAVPGAPDLLDASDSGVSSSDQITNVDTPSFGVSVEPGADALVYAGGTEVGSDVADGTGAATLTASALTDDTYAFTVKAVDVAGNETVQSSALSVQIDTVAPAVSPAAALPAASDTGRSTVDGITADATPSFDVTGGEAGGALILKAGTTEVASGIADGSGNATLTSSALGEGSHEVTVSGTDLAGNASTPSSAVTVTVDTIAPDAPGAPVLASDTGRDLTDRITSASTPSFTVSTEALAAIDLIENLSNIGSAVADGTGSASPASGSALSDGGHSVTAQATDVAGNVSAESSPTAITIDTSAPAAPVSIDLAATSDSGSSTTDDITNDSTPSFAVVFAEPNALVKLYDGSTAQATPATGDASVTVTADVLGDGAHGMKATASDVAGNESPMTAALTITVDTIAPAQPAAPDLDPASDTGSSGTDDITGDTTPTFSLSSYEVATTAKLVEGATVLGSGVVGSGGDASVTSSTLAQGIHNVAWQGIDVAGNPSAASPALSVTIDTGAPTVVLTTTSALTGQFKAVFSENVSPVNSSNVVLRVTGTTVNVPATVAYDSGTKTATLKTTSPLVAGQRYTFIVGPSGATKPSDAAGSSVSSTSPSVRASTVEQETSASAKQLWAIVANSGAYKGSYAAARMNGDTATYSFNGTLVTWYALLGPDQGKARVVIDGVSRGDFDLYRATNAYKAPFPFSVPAGSHTLKVIALGTRNASSRNTTVTVDAFKVGSTVVDQSAASYAWQSVVASSASSGRYVRADVTGSAFTFTFRGTGIDWVTVLGPSMGKATVTIDGTSYGTVDNWASSFRFGVLRSYRGLSDGVHTIRIVVAGQHRAGATGNFIAADRFTVI